MLIDRRAVASGGLAATFSVQCAVTNLARQNMWTEFTGNFRRDLYRDTAIGTGGVTYVDLITRDGWLQFIVAGMEEPQ